MVMIEQAFHAYTKTVEASQRPPTRHARKAGWVEWLNKDDHLRTLVKQLEEGREFSALLEATRSAFRSDDWHSSRSESSWRDAICQFFRRTGYYTDTFFNGLDTPRTLVKRYEKAFQRRHVETTYLSPMEFVKFPKQELKFSGFEIRRFKKEEFDKIVGNEVNRVFYPNAEVDTCILQEYWFIVVRAEEEVRRWGTLTISKEAVGMVSPTYTRFPPAIEPAPKRLVLFDWLEKPQEEKHQKEQKPRKACWPYGLPFGFETPFVILVDDCDLERPNRAPDCATLKSFVPKGEDPYTGKEYNGHHIIFNLNESRIAAFEQCIQRADECLGHLRLETKDTHWPFLKVAADNLNKAFFTDGLDQLLWHITDLEAMLGERGPGLTESRARRRAAILGTTKRERENCKKDFKHLYDLRSKWLHGRKFKQNTHRQRLFEARMVAVRVTIWFVHYLGEIAARINEGRWRSDVPKREDLLTVLDRSEADRVRLSVLLNNLPKGFPVAPDWSP